MFFESTESLIKRFYKNENHPYRIYESKIHNILKYSDTILDAGCGRTAPILKKFLGKCTRLIGVDLEENEGDLGSIEYIKADISAINEVPSESVNIVISRAVLEHVENPDKVFKEINRIMANGAKFIFLVPNFYDYGSLLSMIIPNKYHSKIVNKVEGRPINDTFPAYYKVNTYSAVNRLCKKHGFEIISFEYLGQYPSYLMFNRILFLIGTLYDKAICKYNFLAFLRGWILVVLIKCPR